MWQKIKLKLKWIIGRDKVIKRYREIMNNYPSSPIYREGDDFEQYAEQVSKHMCFLNRTLRLNNIAIRRIEKLLHNEER